MPLEETPREEVPTLHAGRHRRVHSPRDGAYRKPDGGRAVCSPADAAELMEPIEENTYQGKEIGNMKHFRVCIEGGNHEFEYRCSSISDAYDAVLDATAAFEIPVELEDVMTALVNMKRANQTSAKWYRIRVSVEDGEV